MYPTYQTPIRDKHPDADVNNKFTIRQDSKHAVFLQHNIYFC